VIVVLWISVCVSESEYDCIMLFDVMFDVMSVSVFLWVFSTYVKSAEWAL